MSCTVRCFITSFSCSSMTLACEHGELIVYKSRRQGTQDISKCSTTRRDAQIATVASASRIVLTKDLEIRVRDHLRDVAVFSSTFLGHVGWLDQCPIHVCVIESLSRLSQNFRGMRKQHIATSLLLGID